MLLTQLENITEFIYQFFPPTPQYAWPLLSQRCGSNIWVKHENHTPLGAFKVRGGLYYLSQLRQKNLDINGVIAATRGNHGQSIGYAAKQFGYSATIVVPYGNNPDKNRAMKALGVKLIEHGQDFQEALEFASELSKKDNLHWIPSFHTDLMYGVASCGLEFLRAVPDIDTVYVPIGLGSGICGMITARNALGLKTKIVGVVAENAPMYALSFAQKQPVSTTTANTLADGLACRVPNEEALGLILNGVERIVTVSEDAILEAIAYYFADTHNLAEGAGAAPLAALLQEKLMMQGKTVGLVLSGGNVDQNVLMQALGKYLLPA